MGEAELLDEVVGEGGIAVIRVLMVADRGLDGGCCWGRVWG